MSRSDRVPAKVELIYGSPQLMLLAIDLHKDFINVEGVTIASVFSLETPGVVDAELHAPLRDRFTVNGMPRSAS